MKMTRKNANKANEVPKIFQIILLMFPKIVELNSQTIYEEYQRSRLTGTIDEIGHDVKRINEIGISHIIFGYNFSPIKADIDSIIDVTKRLTKFA